jgi:MFS family permease
VKQKNLLLIITFLLSASTVLVGRGIYFYTEKCLHFDKIHNLLLALFSGLCYSASAVVSHRLAGRFGEKKVLASNMLLQIPALFLLQSGNIPMLILGSGFIAVLYGNVWPVVESFIVSGDTPELALKSVGKFSISWSFSTPVALLFAGYLIDLNRWALFAAAGLLVIASAALVWLLPARPGHLAIDHPDRPEEKVLESYSHLLVSARWLMFCSYCLFWILAAVLPVTFSRLHVRVTNASQLFSIIDVMRTLVFVLFQVWAAWHGRKAPLWIVIAGIPAGFCLAMTGGNLWLIVAGEAIFGVASGICYYTSLYYAMVIKNASVEAGGTHEGVIGMGSAAGPMLAAAGYWCGTAWNSELAGMIAGVGPLILICTLQSILRLRK